ncbi:hypothetical protein AM587_10013069 [Phytophthora nicotianae]|uniref:Uncharacterized protein n=1 Tax=Phytophthora nicotianae TaxID=4792 RepID=A0A0W8D6S5_PHYNI|nr:hypothetical protein AM587_10013069 [Phytophthora nicotianae]
MDEVLKILKLDDELSALLANPKLSIWIQYGRLVESVPVDSLYKRKFLRTSPDSNDILDSVYIQNFGDKYVMLHSTMTKDHPDIDNGSSIEEDDARADEKN